MFQNLRTYILNGNRFGGVEHTSNNGQEYLYSTILKKAKNEVLIDSRSEANFVKELAATFPKNTSVFLIINNENVLTKEIDGQIRDPLKLVHTAFPNINLSEFYYEVIVQNDIHFISICRRSYVMETIETYKKNGISVTNLSLGNSIFASIIGFIDSNQISSSNAFIDVSDNEIKAIEKKEQSEFKLYDINGLEVNNKNILSTSGALASILIKKINITNFGAETQQLVNDFKSIMFFKQLLKFGLILIFSLLLINFLIFNYYFNEVNILEQTAQINKEAKSQVLELNAKVLKAQKKVEDMLQNSTSKSSYFINDLLQNLPTTIQLIELNYQPLKKRIKAEEIISIELNIILISGESIDSEEFSKWTNVLERKKWIHKVEVVNYSDITNSLSNFSIKILMNND